MLLDLNRRTEKERHANSNPGRLNSARAIDPVIGKNLIDRSDITMKRNEEVVVNLLTSIGISE